MGISFYRWSMQYSKTLILEEEWVQNFYQKITFSGDFLTPHSSTSSHQRKTEDPNKLLYHHPMLCEECAERGAQNAAFAVSSSVYAASFEVFS